MAKVKGLRSATARRRKGISRVIFKVTRERALKQLEEKVKSERIAFHALIKRSQQKGLSLEAKRDLLTQALTQYNSMRSNAARFLIVSNRLEHQEPDIPANRISIAKRRENIRKMIQEIRKRKKELGNKRAKEWLNEGM